MMAAEGYHAGDMPNLHIPQSGDLTVEVMNTAVTLEKGKPNSVFDADLLDYGDPWKSPDRCHNYRLGGR